MAKIISEVLIIKEKIDRLVEKYIDEVIEIRRYLHAHPEISFQEKETSDYLEKTILQLGLHPNRIVSTGIFTDITGVKEGKTIALRADIDALPIQEDNDIFYKSVHQGIMHACGHDVHAASLIGVMKIISEIKNNFKGTVRFIFQPAEEKIPGGAMQMIQAGVLRDPVPDVIIGLHVDPEINSGKIGFRPGVYMASSDEVYIEINGKGGHAAMPWKTVDPVVISAQLITALQQIVSRYSKTTIPSVLSFGKIYTSADSAINVIPSKVFLEGTFRTFDEKWREEAHHKIKKMAEQIAISMGATANVRILKGYPVLKNDESLTTRAMIFAREFLGNENIIDLEMRMTAEDFSYYSHHIPACFYRLGVRNEGKGIKSMLHTSTFNIDEDALKTSMSTMTYLTLKELEF